jgi:hypothetical protein
MANSQITTNPSDVFRDETDAIVGVIPLRPKTKASRNTAKTTRQRRHRQRRTGKIATPPEVETIALPVPAMDACPPPRSGPPPGALQTSQHPRTCTSRA